MSRLIVYALAIFRVTHLLVAERGPFDVFDWLRAKAGVYYVIGLEPQGRQSEHPNFTREADGFWGELMNCPLCLSGWVGVPVMIGYFLKNGVLDGIASWLAVWGIVVALFKAVGYDE